MNLKHVKNTKKNLSDWMDSKDLRDLWDWKDEMYWEDLKDLIAQKREKTHIFHRKAPLIFHRNQVHMRNTLENVFLIIAILRFDWLARFDCSKTVQLI